VSPSLDGSLRGFQVGHDVVARETASGYRQHAGVYIGRTRLDGDVKGFALGLQNSKAGDIRLDGDALGAYWTLVAPERWYLDTVLQYTDLDGRARSDRGTRLDLNGHVWSGSLEAGYPFVLNAQWELEPQAQLIAQQVSLHSDEDGVSRVSQDSDTSWTSRLGLRLKGSYLAGTTPREPYLRANLWRSFGKDDSTTFDGLHPVSTGQAASWYDVGLGLTARLNEQVSLYGGLDYGNNVDSRQREHVGGNIGVRVSW
jgi:outer membrane autotransporter protein